MASSSRGFSLVESLLALAMGLLLMASVMELFRQAINVNTKVAQRSEMQQNVLAALNMMSQDLSMAATGFPQGGLQLPYGTGTSARFCVGTDNVQHLSRPALRDWLFVITPGDGLVLVDGVSTDVVTLVYRDPTIPLDMSPLASISNDGTSITLSSNGEYQTALNAAGNVPVQPGDVLVLYNAKGYASAVVTSASGNSINMESGVDPLQFNQTAAAVGNIQALKNFPATTPAYMASTAAFRIQIITYYIDNSTNRLMRQVNCSAPVPVAENITNLQFTFDIFREGVGGGATAELPTFDFAQGQSPNQIRKVNITVAFASSEEEITSGKKNFTTLKTSVSVRNLAFRDRYV
jgi:type II secretory pathway pseudopilin PulG